MKNRHFPVRIIAAVLAAMMLSVLVCGCSRTEETVYTQGEKALVNGELAEARSLFDQALHQGIETELSYRGHGIASMGLGYYDEAISDFTEALHSGHGIPSDVEYDINYYLAACFFKLERYEDAEEVYNAIIALRPNSADAYKMRGDTRIALGMRELAAEDYDKAASLEPKNYDRLISILASMTEAGMQEKGREYLEQALDKYGSGMTNYDKGRLCYYLEEYDTAKTYLEQARASSSDYKSSSLLGQTYEKLGDYNYAVSVYESFIASDQSRPEVYNRLGLCRMEMGAYQEALAAFQQGLLLQDPVMAQSLSYNEIVAYEYLGQFRKAAVLMESYLQKYPTDTEAIRENIFLSTR